MSLLNRPPVLESTAGKPTWVRWQIIGFVMLFIFIGHFNRISLTVAADARIMKQFNIPTTQMGMVYSTFLLTYTLCMIPGGLLIDWIGVRRSLALMAFGLALAAAATGLLGFVYGASTGVFSAGFFGSLLVIRALMGIVAAPLHPSGAQAVGHWIPPGTQTWANGLITGMCPLGIAATFIIFGAMVARFDWPTAFLILAAVTALFTLTWWIYATDRPEHHRRCNDAEVGLIRAGRPVENGESELAEDLKELGHDLVEASLPYEAEPSAREPLWRDRNLLLLTASYALNGYFQYLFIYWMHYYFFEKLQLSESTAAFYSGLPPLTMALGMPLGGFICDALQSRVGRYRSRAGVAIVGMMGGALFLAFGIAAKQPEWIVAWFSLALGSLGMSESPFWATVIDAAPGRGGAAAAFLNTGGNAGGMLAPVVTPWASLHFGWPVGLGLGVVASFAAAMLWFWVKPPEELPAPAVAKSPASG